MILALDPSSSRTGYAILTDAGQYVEAGSLLPDRVKDPPNARIRAMVAELSKLVVDHRITQIIIEDTSGKVASRARGRGVNGAGLAIYGKAVGWIIAASERLCPGHVETVLENEWTRQVSKASRAARTRAKYPAVKDSEDLDALDALGLADWWISRRTVAA